MKKLKLAVAALATSAILGTGAASAVNLKASHQWPGGKGDMRDEMVQMIAKHMADKKNGCKYSCLSRQKLVQAKRAVGCND
jgi:TRAP-type C4-dicarboxylate transport system substrate-binding protein